MIDWGLNDPGSAGETPVLLDSHVVGTVIDSYLTVDNTVITSIDNESLATVMANRVNLWGPYGPHKMFVKYYKKDTLYLGKRCMLLVKGSPAATVALGN